MPSTRDIRRRIKSVKNTAQITKAMQLVAAAKMKKAQDQANLGRPYAELMNQVLVNLKDTVSEDPHPFFSPGEGTRDLVIFITSDKGLCGAFNGNLFKRFLVDYKDTETDYVTIGRKGAQFLSRLKKNIIANFSIKDPAKFPEARIAGNFIQEQFRTGTYRRVLVVFNNFVNTVTIVPTVEEILPISAVKLGGKRDFQKDNAFAEEHTAAVGTEYIFEPSAEEVLNAVLPQYVNNTLFQMVLESRASEHSSRMVAMKNATDNAKQLIKDLTLEYNKLRQAAITNELLEITTAKMALE